ncbi:MAG: response regulator [Proteobacteria bacterium]|nr:response regulator [Pseudomonadota bacterium]
MDVFLPLKGFFNLKNFIKNSYDNMIKNNSLSKEYLIFAVIIVGFTLVTTGLLSYVSFKKNVKENSRILQKEAKNLEVIISESFDYTNQINSHIGQQIAQRGAADLKFILNLFSDASKIKHRNSDLFSWSSFDWVDNKNYQKVNSKLGIRKNPPDMSARQYTTLSPQNPGTLQVSFPTIGNPSGAWVIPAGTGIIDKNQKYLGAIVVGFDIAELTSKVSQKINQKVSFIVLDQDLRIILKSADVDLARDSDFFQNNFNKKIFSEKEGVLTKKITIGQIDFSYHKSFIKYPYIALTGFDRSFLDKQFVALILPRIIEFVCLAAFFLLVLYLFKTKILTLLEVEKLLRKSLEKANAAKDQILFSISHDIKNYIFGIGGLGKIILESKDKSEKLKNEDLKIVETICDQAEELRYFVEDLLDLSQVETGTFALKNLKEADVKALIGAVLMINRKLISDHKAIIKTNIESNLPKFTCDPRRVKQILANLITNAVKYNKPQGEVLVTAKHLQKTNQLYIEIADQGFGMDEEEIKKYFSGHGGAIDKSEVAKFKEIDSHGIGMPIVFGLVELHHGKIEAESQKGVGTKIKLYFDLSGFGQKNNEQIFSQERSTFFNSATAPQNNDVSLKVPQKSNAKNKSILLVEDNPVNIKIAYKALEGKGYRVMHAENGLEALEIIDQENFDLILMDGEMPVMNGYEAARKIREGKVFKNFKNYKTIPIVAFMSCCDEQTLKKALDSGMNDYVEKSISRTKLFEMVEKYCGS